MPSLRSGAAALFGAAALPIVALAAICAPAHATDINFAGLPGAAANPGTPFTAPYTRNGFTVIPAVGQFRALLSVVNYVGVPPFPPTTGAPEPLLTKDNAPAAILVTAIGRKSFLFSSVGLANNNDLSGTPATYQFIGTRRGVQVFSQTGAVGEHGEFEVHRNTHALAAIDALRIALFGSDAEIDDIVVTPVVSRIYSRTGGLGSARNQAASDRRRRRASPPSLFSAGFAPGLHLIIPGGSPASRHTGAAALHRTRRSASVDGPSSRYL